MLKRSLICFGALASCDQSQSIVSQSNMCSISDIAEFSLLNFEEAGSWSQQFSITSEVASDSSLPIPLGGRLYVSNFELPISQDDERAIAVISASGSCVFATEAVGISALDYQQRVEISSVADSMFFEELGLTVGGLDFPSSQFREQALFVIFDVVTDGLLQSFEAVFFSRNPYLAGAIKNENEAIYDYQLC